MMQLSGLTQKGYKHRFAETAYALKAMLESMGCEICEDGTGMAYVVVKNGIRIGGPSSRLENAMSGAAYHLAREQRQ